MDSQTLIIALLSICGFFLTRIVIKVDKIADNINGLIAADAQRDIQVKNLERRITELEKINQRIPA